MLLEKSSLKSRWAELLATASHIDIAVAWITSRELTEDLLALSSRPGCCVRVLAGVHDYFTSAECLRRLNGKGLVKIGVGTGGRMFHPKLYSFTLPERRLCWVGSANLTTAGFGGNTELVYEYEADGASTPWFEREWANSWPPDDAWLDKYENAKASVSHNQISIEQMAAPAPPASESLSLPARSLRALGNWDSYYADLRHRDLEWQKEYEGRMGIFDGETNYYSIIREAQSIFDKDWESLCKRDASVLLGLVDSDKKNYGLLGSMGGAGRAKGVFLTHTAENLAARREIQDELLRLKGVPLHSLMLPSMAKKAYEVITNRKGVGGGVATRLLALARPEVFPSVNSESIGRLGQWSGVSESDLGKSSGYEKLVRWIMTEEWWKSPEPMEGIEREAWSYRAALIDGLIYGGEHFAANS